MSGPLRSSVTISYQVDPEEMARRGRLGGIAVHAKHDSRELTAPGRAAFLARFTNDDDRRAYFQQLAQKSATARRERALAASGGAA